MTMQNPDKPILAKDLNDYHNKILPYLGGMPEIYANKFAKGDLYDTNEKMIGKWIDGKPLYQRVYEIDVDVSSSGFSQDIISTSNLDIDIVKYDGIMVLSGEYYPLNFYRSSGEYGVTVLTSNNGHKNKLSSKAGYNGKVIQVTIQYTKSSDSANSFNIGEATDYSTEEKIVGTWIDNSYIYQKTYSGLNINVTSGQWVNAVTAPSNCKKIINNEILDTTSHWGFMGTDIDNGMIQLFNTRSGNAHVTDITIQYIKNS